MRPSSKRAIQITGILCAVLIAYHILFPVLPPDREQIARQIDVASLAIHDHNVGRFIGVLSDHYADDNGMTKDGIRVLIVRGLRGSSSVTVDVRSTEIDVHGDDAVSTSYVGVAVDAATGGWSRPSQEVVVTWKREPVNRFLIIPAKEWRVVKASYGGLLEY